MALLTSGTNYGPGGKLSAEAVNDTTATAAEALRLAGEAKHTAEGARDTAYGKEPQITILPVSKGGTGAAATPSIITNLASTAGASPYAVTPRPGVTGILPVSNGGTGNAHHRIAPLRVWGTDTTYDVATGVKTLSLPAGTTLDNYSFIGFLFGETDGEYWYYDEVPAAIFRMITVQSTNNKWVVRGDDCYLCIRYNNGASITVVKHSGTALRGIYVR